MTIGPEPRTRIFEMSVLFGIYLVIMKFLSSRPSQLRGQARQPARGGTLVFSPVSKHAARQTQGPSTAPGMPGSSTWRENPSPLPLLHHLRELFEQIMRVVWPGRGFRVILHGEERHVPVAQAFQRLVVQVQVSELDFALRQRIGVDGEVVVVRRDLDLAGL